MIKFLHIADIHLDTSFYSRKETIRRKLREGIRDAFERVIDICISEKVNALLIGGDLFDNDKLSFKTEQFLIRQFERLKTRGIKVFYANGNHDPGEMGYRANAIKWPDNVIVFKDDNISEVELLGPNGDIVGKIIGCGHRTSKEGRNLIKMFPGKKDAVPHIGLAHAMVANTSETKNHERYLPCTIEDLKRTKYDYWALGHIHRRQEISKYPHIYYSGNIQGRNPKEIGEKGGLLVNIDNDKNITVDFKPLSKIQWHQIFIKGLDDIKDYRSLKKYLLKSIENYLKKNELYGCEIILRLELEGRAFLKKELEIEENKEDIIEELLLDLNLLDLELKTDRLLNTLNIEDYRDGDHVLSYVLDILENIEYNEELMDKLTKLSFAGDISKNKKNIREYIIKLVEDLDEEAVNWMVGEVDEIN